MLDALLAEARLRWRLDPAAGLALVVAYVLLAVFLVLSGYFFYSDLVFFILFGGFTLATGLWQFVFLDMRMVAMLILPLLTMRLFAEEKKLGTLELLWTYPVRDGEIVLGKFFAALIFYLAMLLPTAVVMPFSGITRRQPSRPPSPASSTDSKKKLSRMLPFEKPSTRKVPISRARRATAAYMVFMAAKLEPTAMMMATKMPTNWIGAPAAVCSA